MLVFYFSFCVSVAVFGVPQDGLRGRLCCDWAVFQLLFGCGIGFSSTRDTWLHVDTAGLWIWRYIRTEISSTSARETSETSCISQYRITGRAPKTQGKSSSLKPPLPAALPLLIFSSSWHHNAQHGYKRSKTWNAMPALNLPLQSSMTHAAR